MGDDKSQPTTVLHLLVCPLLRNVWDIVSQDCAHLLPSTVRNTSSARIDSDLWHDAIRPYARPAMSGTWRRRCQSWPIVVMVTNGDDGGDDGRDGGELRHMPKARHHAAHCVEFVLCHPAKSVNAQLWQQEQHKPEKKRAPAHHADAHAAQSYPPVCRGVRWILTGNRDDWPDRFSCCCRYPSAKPTRLLGGGDREAQP